MKVLSLNDAVKLERHQGGGYSLEIYFPLKGGGVTAFTSCALFQLQTYPFLFTLQNV